MAVIKRLDKVSFPIAKAQGKDKNLYQQALSLLRPKFENIPK